MRICLVITSLGLGGAQKQVCDLADEYIKLGHDVLLISLTGSIVIQPKNRIEIVELKLTKNPLSFIKACRLYLKEIKKFSPDVIHSHMVHANIFTRLMRIFLPVNKLISTAHNTNEGGKIRCLAYRYTDKLSDISTNVSNEAVLAFEKNGSVPIGKMLTMYNGINLKHYKSHKSNDSNLKYRDELKISLHDKILLSVGRLSAQKDYPNLLNAFHLLLQQRKDCHLVIIGNGELEKDLKNLVVKLDMTKFVHFLGFRNDISDWMNCADLYVMSSKWEGLPLVIIEAMACNCFVVATDCGGVAEVMAHREYLVPVNNPQRLFVTMQKALSLPKNEKDSLLISAQKKVKVKFSIDLIAKKWISLYEK